MESPSKLERLLAELNSGEDERAEKAAQRLADCGLEGAQALDETYHSRSGKDAAEVEARWWAVRALAEFAAPRAKRVLRQALKDADSGVRQGAALGLRMNPDPESIPDLIQMLDDEDPLAARMAADALVVLGNPAVPALIEALEQASPAAQVEAVRALALIGDPQSIPALFKRLDCGSVIQEHWAEEGLERMGVGMAFFKP